MALLVQKYGGTSVGSVDLINRVAARVAAVRERGDQVAVVVSAMGDSTDRLVDLAKPVTSEPDTRELDVLLTTGEQVSIALLAMALNARGVPARSFTGRTNVTAAWPLDSRSAISRLTAAFATYTTTWMPSSSPVSAIARALLGSRCWLRVPR